MIRYKLYQNKMEGNTGYNLWYARAVCDETYDTEMLAKHMSTHNTPYSPGVIHGRAPFRLQKATFRNPKGGLS